MKLWDIDTGRELASRYVHPKAVYGTDLLPDMSRSVWGYLGGQVTVMDHGKARRRRELERRIPAAMEALQVNARDPTALAVMADWHAFGLRWKWALELYEQARAAGADVPALQMARCYWFLSRPADARREFERALQRREAPEVYLRLCIGAIDRKNAATQPATAPGSRPSQ